MAVSGVIYGYREAERLLNISPVSRKMYYRCIADYSKVKKSISLTKRDIEAALSPAPSSKRLYYHFKQLPGLILQVTSSGVKTFQVYKRLGYSTYRKSLGRYPDLSPEDAMRLGLEQIRSLALGQDPRIEKEKAKLKDITFGALFIEYLEKYAKPHTKTWKDVSDNRLRYFQRWEHFQISAMKRIDVQNWVKDLAETKGKHTANRNFETLRAIINWGLKKELIELRQNPCVGIDMYKTKSRERFLLPGAEFDRFRRALDSEANETIRDFIWMCLFTGMRKSNVLSMSWADIKWELGFWMIIDSKNGDSQAVNLTRNALALLQRRYDNRMSERWVFPGTGKTGHLMSPKSAWKKLIQRAGIEDLRIHDLRRTVGSYMAIQGVDSKIIGKALGHRSIQATAVYARLTQSPVRLALENTHSVFVQEAELVS